MGEHEGYIPSEAIKDIGEEIKEGGEKLKAVNMTGEPFEQKPISGEEPTGDFTDEELGDWEKNVENIEKAA